MNATWILKAKVMEQFQPFCSVQFNFNYFFFFLSHKGQFCCGHGGLVK